MMEPIAELDDEDENFDFDPHFGTTLGGLDDLSSLNTMSGQFRSRANTWPAAFNQEFDELTAEVAEEDTTALGTIKPEELLLMPAPLYNELYEPYHQHHGQPHYQQHDHHLHHQQQQQHQHDINKLRTGGGGYNCSPPTNSSLGGSMLHPEGIDSLIGAAGNKISPSYYSSAAVAGTGAGGSLDTLTLVANNDNENNKSSFSSQPKSILDGDGSPTSAIHDTEMGSGLLDEVGVGVGVGGLAGANITASSLVAALKKNTSRRNAWGNMSYADLITQAINGSPEKRLTLSQIYDWMVQNVDYFKDKGDSNSSAGWKVGSPLLIVFDS